MALNTGPDPKKSRTSKPEPTIVPPSPAPVVEELDLTLAPGGTKRKGDDPVMTPETLADIKESEARKEQQMGYKGGDLGEEQPLGGGGKE